MPGRLVLYNDINFIKDMNNIFPNINAVDIKKIQNYNIAPTNTINVLLDTYIYTNASFGFISSWAKDMKNININARSESLFEKVTFRESFKNKRCLIPVNGFYEWEKKDKEKIPYYIKSSKNDYLVMAGLYNEFYDEKTNQVIINVCIITTEPNDVIKKIHDRMPVILPIKDCFTYLNKNSTLKEVNDLFKTYESKLITLHEVSKEVNKVSNNNSELIKEFKNILYKQESLF